MNCLSRRNYNPEREEVKCRTGGVNSQDFRACRIDQVNIIMELSKEVMAT